MSDAKLEGRLSDFGPRRATDHDLSLPCSHLASRGSDSGALRPLPTLSLDYHANCSSGASAVSERFSGPLMPCSNGLVPEIASRSPLNYCNGATTAVYLGRILPRSSSRAWPLGLIGCL